MSTREHAQAEMALCEAVLAKGGLTVLTATLEGAQSIEAFGHYPPDDVFDPDSNAQWFYHSHPAEEGSLEHGHFHCFIRPEGPQGSIHHLAAIGVDANGRLLRLFTVNQWVVGDDWADAPTLLPLLGRFDIQMPKPSYLVNRWLTAIFVAYADEIAGLISERDRVLAAHVPPEGMSVHSDQALEVTSEFLIA